MSKGGAGMGPASILMIEDALMKIIHRDGSKSLRRYKEQGLVPMGQHSCFGDFPPESAPRKKKAQVEVAPEKLNVKMDGPPKANVYKPRAIAEHSAS